GRRALHLVRRRQGISVLLPSMSDAFRQHRQDGSDQDQIARGVRAPMKAPNQMRAAGLLACLALTTVAAVWVWAHEGHQPLPTRGVSVDPVKGLIVLSPETRVALRPQTAEVKEGSLPDEVLAQATVVAPWQQRSYVTTR